ncbi:oxidoreductase [Photobacterium sp. 2_MG-2023]|uniref:oxidoreductase n=1 Tax=Photobacterium sp. 2_MG-2023 TaxID=3062663 RepID=UPI0026E2826B|nr:oxidoreductase [Photobacterium sp. 2_MG-2023]MDO6579739.1 oxidoreductase [Photobacterium sp. 2_MG-2023]
MNNLLNDKVILVAGAGGLLGATLVFEILKQGAKVIAADLSINTMRPRLEKLGINVDADEITLIELDVTNEDESVAFFSSVELLHGAVNATYPRNKTYGAHFFDVSLASFNENLALHLGSAFLFTQQCAKYFEKHKHTFSLVNISSVYGVIAPRFEVYKNTKMTMPVEYAAIKSALLHLNKYAVSYINDSRFRINSVSPGGIFDSQPQEFLNSYKQYTNGAGMLNVDDICGTVLYLLSEQSKFVTGQNIIVDDGFSL